MRSISRNGSVRINITKHLQLVRAETANALQGASVVTCRPVDDKHDVVRRVTLTPGGPMTAPHHPVDPTAPHALTTALNSINEAIHPARTPPSPSLPDPAQPSSEQALAALLLLRE